MFKSPQAYRSFLTVVLTYALDLIGFSIAFPVLAPLLLNPDLNFFASGTADTTKATVLGLLFAAFGIAQFLGAPIAGVMADHYGRYKIFLWTIFLSAMGYVLMALGVYQQDLAFLFIGRVVSGLCSGNVSLAQSATADLTEPKHRSRAFGILLGIGGLGFVVGPWVGGKLANPDWLSGSGAFIFAAVAALINFFMIIFFFVETFKRKEHHAKVNLWSSFKDLRIVFHHRVQRTILIASLLFSVGWAFNLIFFPTFLVQKFSLGADKIGDIYAYQSLVWFFGSMFLNKELATKFNLKTLILWGTGIASIGVALCVTPQELWPYWIIIPVALTGGALAFVNFGALLSTNASDEMQGRVMGANGSMWSFGQILAPLIAGPLAGWNIYSPLLLGSLFILTAFIYFLFQHKKV